ncbi:MAG: NCS2 family permease [Pseudomonadota bacterium]
MSYLDRTFAINSHGSSVQRELVAGVTTFLAMAYISVVNPAILSETGMSFDAVFVATCLAAAFGCFAMGILANYPIALAPGMGQNAFFAYGICIGMGYSWQAALGAVFVSGLLFILISILPLREWLINAIPKSLKMGIAAGIGLFLAIIALTNAGIVVDNPATLVAFGDLTSTSSLLLIAGFAIIVALTARNIPGAIIIGVLLVSLAAWSLGTAQFNGVLSMPPNPSAFLALDIPATLEWTMLTVILTLLLVDVFDTAGTLVGVTTRAGLIGDDGKLPRLKRALIADSSATAVGALFGTSSTTSYVESAAGVESGGRTGLTSVVVGVLFLICLFAAPLAQSIPPFATAAALLFVSCYMIKSLIDIDWDDLSESAPAIVTAVSMPLSYSIADGIGLGFITYVGIKVLAGRFSDCSLAVVFIAAIFAFKFAAL